MNPQTPCRDYCSIVECVLIVSATSSCSLILCGTQQVKLVYSKFIRWSIFVKGEFTDWKPERLIADAGGKYCFMKKLSPGRWVL